jgi:ketosteroid isomerase-like protein
MRRILLLAVVSVIAFGLPLFAGSDEEVANEVIAITKAQWAAEVAGESVDSIMEIAAEEYTEFNPGAPTRLDGKALNTKIAEANAGASGKMVMGEMTNAKVQVYGDVAILTYNFIGAMKDKDGVVEPNLAKSTRVYAKMDGTWKLVHANFAPVGD